jgi:hypothetical protein
MAFDPSMFLPSPSDWFSTSVEYEGWGRAEFADPEGSVEGLTRMSFNELGWASIEMRPDLRTLQSHRPLRFGLTEFLSGERPKEHKGTSYLSMTLESKNPCTGLEVATPQGRFHSHDVSYHSHSEVWGDDDQEEVIERITFDVFLSRFNSEVSQEARFWVLPLTNFVSEFTPAWAELNRHPLRIFPTPEVPDEITHVPHGPDEEKAKGRAISALLTANSKNQLIAFEFNDALGFIEALADYEDRKEDLLTGKERTRLTTVMVGEVGTNPCETLDQVAEWLRPQGILALLTLATGTEVGAPWIELRDGQGRLVQRFHRRLREPRFSRGHHVIDELPFKNGEGRDTRTGYLISKATSHPEALDEPPLRASIIHLVRSKYEGQSLDESMAHLCRGLDGLCEHYGVAKQNLAKSLDADQARVVKEALKRAFKEIREVKDTAMAAGDQEAATALNTIEGKVTNASNIERKFGLALADLLERFGMPDAKVMDEHYAQKPRADKREHWVDVVTAYRTAVIHYGYLDLGPGGHDWQEVRALVNHLHDIMARIILRTLGYDGGYHPTVISGRATPFALDWVKPDTGAGRLGYE